MAQTGGVNDTKCGPETWSTDKMMYVDVPCIGAGDAAQQQRPVGAAPVMQPQQAAAPGPAYSMGDQSCGASNSVAITDEYGRKYNCRGDRIH
jgi:hypothetical protein